jgi:hypothetical protein
MPFFMKCQLSISGLSGLWGAIRCFQVIGPWQVFSLRRHRERGIRSECARRLLIWERGERQMERAVWAGRQTAETSEGGRAARGGGIFSRFCAALVSDDGEDRHSAAAHRAHRRSTQRTRRQRQRRGNSKRCGGAGERRSGTR